MGREQSALIWPKATMQYYPDTTQTRNQQGTICVKDQGSLPIVIITIISMSAIISGGGGGGSSSSSSSSIIIHLKTSPRARPPAPGGGS